MDLIKFLFGVFLCIGGCIGLMKWIDTWGKEDKIGKQQIKLDKDIKKEIEEEIEGEVKKKATPKIQAVIDRRKIFLQKKRDVEKMRELSFKYRDLKQSEIKEELIAEKCFTKYVLIGNLSVGSKNDYFDFLDSYIEHGGIASHHYENNIEESLKQQKNRDNMIYIARNEIEIFPSHGSPGKMIIVMPDCKVIPGYGARNQFYCYDDISNQKYAFWIPTYKDWVKRKTG